MINPLLDHDVDSHADSGRMDFLCALLWVTGYTVQLSNKPLLDVRLSNEHTKVSLLMQLSLLFTYIAHNLIFYPVVGGYE